jgi:heme oxygenase (mycobilin-producing)
MKDQRAVLIDAFEGPAGEDDVFVSGWQRARDFLRTQEGYLSSQLHRSISPAANFRFVNIALWESEEACRVAIEKPGFRGASVPDTCHASPYRVVHADDPVNVQRPVRVGRQTAPGEPS